VNKLGIGIVLGVILLALLAGYTRQRTLARATPAAVAAGLPAAQLVVDGLQEPVALAFLSTRVMLVAEWRTGRIRWVENGTLRQVPFATVAVPNPPGYHEYGLLGLAVDPDYPGRPYVYAFHTMAGSGNRADGQRIVRFTVKNGVGVGMITLVDGLPAGASCCHNGGRLAFGPDGTLFATLGDTQRPELAQDYTAPAGKVLRFTRGGGAVADNPLMTHDATSASTIKGETDPAVTVSRTSIYAVGFRNPFGLAFDGRGNLYVTDNGPDRGDEIDRVVAGDNYGWPTVMGYANDPHFRAPLWATGRSTIAPTGAAFYTGTDFPQYRGNLFFAAYNDGNLRRAIFSNPDRIAVVQAVTNIAPRAKLDVKMGPDGKLYFSDNHAVYRLVKK
jgi:glucose/arabinose dehydrogenase